jgi:hypothetical protein
VYPAFRTRLRLLRSKALEDFKTKLGSSLNNGELFATSVGTLTKSIMLEFEKGVEGNNSSSYIVAYTFLLKIYIRCHYKSFILNMSP